jgi:hypothetical protein
MDEKETMKMTCTLDTYVENHHLGWTLKFGGGFVVLAQHWFELSSVSETETKVEHNEDFAGYVWFVL